MIPLTGFEQHDRWSTRAEEELFLTQVAAETDLTLTSPGRSVLGHPLWRAEIGSGPTLAIVGALHPNEPSGRDAALAWVRDLAYSTDPAVLDYLSSHRVVVIPTGSPDGLTNRRDNLNGVNLNRDFFQLSQPETRAIQSVLIDTDPDIILDLHEAGADGGYEWRPHADGMPGTDSGIKALSIDCMDAAKSALSSLGFQSLDYPIRDMPWSGLSTAGAAHHRVTVLSEPGWRITTQQQRIDISMALFESTMLWHQEHQAAITAARAAARLAAETDTGPTPIPTRQFIGTRAVTTVDATGYTPEWDIPQRLLDLHGIESVDGYVPINQPARLIVAALLDPASRDYIVGSPWWEPTPPPTRTGPRLTVKQGGVLYPVREVWHKSDGVRRRVQQITTKRDGVLRSAG